MFNAVTKPKLLGRNILKVAIEGHSSVYLDI